MFCSCWGPGEPNAKCNCVTVTFALAELLAKHHQETRMRFGGFDACCAFLGFKSIQSTALETLGVSKARRVSWWREIKFTRLRQSASRFGVDMVPSCIIYILLEFQPHLSRQCHHYGKIYYIQLYYQTYHTNEKKKKFSSSSLNRW